MPVTEIWKDIDGFPGYQISSFGNVRCFRDFHGEITKKFRMLNPMTNKDGYLYVDLSTIDHEQIHKRVHRLVADTFLGPQPDLVVNHIDGDKLNNRVENIEWVTAKENSTLAAKNGLYKTRPIKIVETGEVFKSIRECASALKSHPSDISHVLSGRYDSLKELHFEYVEQKEKKHKSFLYDYQMAAVKKMFNGCILNGGVGSGKSRTGLYYYFSQCGGSINPDYIPMNQPKDLYIITTAKKRDSLEWEGELANFLISKNPSISLYGDNLKVDIDSWNNIGRYIGVKDAFFIFDEQRVVGRGAWVKAFLKITKSNEWILLSATAGDKWEDYIPVFLANGFYKNITEFRRDHLVYSQYSKYPKVERYTNTGRLIRLRDRILIDMDFKRHTVPHHEDVWVNFDNAKYKEAVRTRWDPYKNEPMQQASVLCYVLRRIVNEDESRQMAILELFEKHPKIIIFYNFDYELDILKGIYYGEDVELAEWNGHKHQPIPDGKRWVYLVQYTAGAEGWNCITTDTIIFYSQNYSYKTVEQARGRIDRLNTPYIDLYYYYLKSRSGIDLAISKALANKKKFNERSWVKW